MKSLVFITCLLAAALASDPEKVKAFYETYEKCAEELGVPKDDKTDLKAYKCVGEKVGLYDEQDVFIKDKGLAYLDTIVSDANKDQAKEILSTCMEQEYGSGSNYEKSIAAIECTVKQGAMNLIDKPQ